MYSWHYVKHVVFFFYWRKYLDTLGFENKNNLQTRFIYYSLKSRKVCEYIWHICMRTHIMQIIPCRTWWKFDLPNTQLSSIPRFSQSIELNLIIRSNLTRRRVIKSFAPFLELILDYATTMQLDMKVLMPGKSVLWDYWLQVCFLLLTTQLYSWPPDVYVR